jgi:hypothetical protein
MALEAHVMVQETAKDNLKPRERALPYVLS